MNSDLDLHLKKMLIMHFPPEFAGLNIFPSRKLCNRIAQLLLELRMDGWSFGKSRLCYCLSLMLFLLSLRSSPSLCHTTWLKAMCITTVE